MMLTAAGEVSQVSTTNHLMKLSSNVRVMPPAKVRTRLLVIRKEPVVLRALFLSTSQQFQNDIFTPPPSVFFTPPPSVFFTPPPSVFSKVKQCRIKPLTYHISSDIHPTPTQVHNRGNVATSEDFNERDVVS